jgi:hypothetical protein
MEIDMNTTEVSIKNPGASGVKSLYIIGGVAAVLQLVTILAYSAALALLGPKPTTAMGYFEIYEQGPLEMVLRGDFLLLILIGLYLGTFPALYAALRKMHPVNVGLAALFTIIAVAGTFATESTFSMLQLAERYLSAGSESAQAQFLAAGEAIIAGDMWNSSAAYMGGILLQGSGVIISLVMLRSSDFSKLTAYSGLIGNGFDLVQHVLHPFAPSVSSTIAMFMGVFYFVWFPMLGRDLLKLARKVESVPNG